MTLGRIGSGGRGFDAEGFRARATEQIPAVLRFARHLTAKPGEAEELVQETFVRAFRSAQTFEGDAEGMRAWLFKILHNVYRSKFKMRIAKVEALDGVEEPAGADEVKWVEGGIDWEAVDEELVRAVRELPEELRAVFLLLAGEELKYREIAEVLGIPIGTVMSRLSRARGMLMAKLGNKYGGRRIVEEREGGKTV